ncbi:GD13306 [Drosophila simulans]|uniref:GD13306 n=1 Tax=Drosophila simulans TaxID=7240 RepID=B4QQ11_DROSI|nr:GD13306 [Drosophila simulans]
MPHHSSKSSPTASLPAIIGAIIIPRALREKGAFLGLKRYAAPFQELEPRKGHVPVYIRHGDEPLSEIHPGLAEAFKEGESQSLVTESPQAETTNPPTTSDAPAPAPSSSTVSDIASFEAIKGKTD